MATMKFSDINKDLVVFLPMNNEINWKNIMANGDCSKTPLVGGISPTVTEKSLTTNLSTLGRQHCARINYKSELYTNFGVYYVNLFQNIGKAKGNQLKWSYDYYLPSTNSVINLDGYYFRNPTTYGSSSISFDLWQKREYSSPIISTYFYIIYFGRFQASAPITDCAYIDNMTCEIKSLVNKTPYNYSAIYSSYSPTTNHKNQSNFAMAFNGTDSFLSLLNVVELNSVTKFSTFFRFKTTDITKQQTFFTKRTDSTNWLKCGLESGSFYIDINSSTSRRTCPITFSNDEWVNLMINYDASQATDATKLKVFFNNIQQTLSGSSVPSSTGNLGVGGTPFVIGAYSWGTTPTECFQGSMCDFYLWKSTPCDLIKNRLHYK